MAANYRGQALTPPIVFTAQQPLVLRPLDPQGFRVETLDGRAIFECAIPYQEVTFHVTSGPDGATAMFTCVWMEGPDA